MTAVGLAAAVAIWLALPPPPQPQSARIPWWWTLSGLVVLLPMVPRSWFALLLVLAPASAAAAFLWCRRGAGHRAERTGALMAEVCDVLAAELAAGRPADLAVAEAARAWPELRLVAEATRLGGDVPAALRELSAIPGARHLRFLAGAWAVTHRTGGGLAAATRRVAESVRLEQATRRVVAGELASARATARLMAGLPVVALLMGSGAGADPWAILLGTPLGIACLAGGLALELGGLWWIELIAREVGR